ncbi:MULTISPECIES: NAD(+)/NADH kinase [Halorussus]|uniref:NAD(+)/NADH kinase n=1 Tax=Halorussus TaxID=1070314 RepID=UPI000E20D4C8|nr:MULTISPECIES: NAD(+)/NADH kinase [Halorussus]NHN58256.1 ATP-NAD kinase [Halorussus sp. JP-T4]
MTLGIVGEGALADRIRDAVADEASVVDGPASEVVAADPDAVAAVGESALLKLVRAEVDAPVLPVDAGPGYGGIAGDRAVDGGDDSLSAIDALLAREFETEPRAVLGVSVGGERVGRALADVMLVTTEPARISEYGVRSRGERVARFRADGVAVSTPTGSHGYGRSAGGPLLEPASGVVGVVPVAPFAVNVDHWVVSADRPVELTVERDEGAVSLLLDDEAVRRVRPHTPVSVREDGHLDLVRVADSRPFFER